MGVIEFQNVKLNEMFLTRQLEFETAMLQFQHGLEFNIVEYVIFN